MSNETEAKNDVTVNLTMVRPVGLKAIDAGIATLSTVTKTVNSYIHNLNMAVALHANEHGDCTRALAIYKAMPASYRRLMVVDWYHLYTNIRFTEKKEGIYQSVGMLKATAKTYREFDEAEAEATPFYQLAETTPEEKPFNFDNFFKAVKALASKADKKIEEGKVPASDVSKITAITSVLKNIDPTALLKAEVASLKAELEALKNPANQDNTNTDKTDDTVAQLPVQQAA